VLKSYGKWGLQAPGYRISSHKLGENLRGKRGNKIKHIRAIFACQVKSGNLGEKEGN